MCNSTGLLPNVTGIFAWIQVSFQSVLQFIFLSLINQVPSLVRGTSLTSHTRVCWVSLDGVCDSFQPCGTKKTDTFCVSRRIV